MATVLVIEDEQETTDVLHAFLQRFGYDSLGARTGGAGLDLVASEDPDLVVLDLGLPDMTGLEVIRRLRDWTEVPVLVLSGTSRRGVGVDALDAGADDFLHKPFDAGDLAARLRAVSRRSTGHDDAASPRRHFGEVTLDTALHQLLVGGVEVRLTSIEWRLLEALTRQPGRLLTHRWLVSQVWDANHGAETQATLRQHVRTLRGKLDDDAARPTYVRTESGIGYRWVAAASPAASPAGASEAPAPAPPEEAAAVGWRGDGWDRLDAALAGLGAHLRTGDHDAATERLTRVRALVDQLSPAREAARETAQQPDHGGPRGGHGAAPA
ncbi:response regulator transcription factor [Nocardioides nanhaiensis]|uniref:Response regulator n=1 Tax=Nocardioides nanhaiensis TaxID=1476871 RepID=A0ABP8WF72_9ACTN